MNKMSCPGKTIKDSKQLYVSIALKQQGCNEPLMHMQNQVTDWLNLEIHQ